MKMLSQYLCALSIASAIAGCASREAASGSASAPATLRIVAIERVYGDLARQLAGPGVVVTTLLDSPSADPHAYEATPRDADAVAAADIVIENGLGYDAFADKLIAASPNSSRVVLNVGALGGHVAGDNPHVWYEAKSLRAITDALATELARREPASRRDIARERSAFVAWIARYSAETRALGVAEAGKSVAITEPVFDYVLHAAGLTIATPPSFSHAIEEGNDPAPQDVTAMRALLSERRVAAFVYNSQTVEPSTTDLLDVARAAHVTIVPVTETLPGSENTQAWIESEVASLRRALRANPPSHSRTSVSSAARGGSSIALR